VAITLPRNALIKLTGLNTYAQRNLQEITGYSVSGSQTTFYTPTTNGLVNGNTVVIANMQGAPTPIWSFTVSNVTANSFRVASALSWPISAARCYKNGTLRYLDFIIYGNTTVKAGDTVTIAGATSMPSGSFVISKSGNTEMIFTQNGSDFAGGASYPDYTAGPSFYSPGGTLTLTATSGTRSPGLTNVYWAIGGGASTATLSDHSRSPLTMHPTEIARGDRTVSGTLRKSHTASKYEFSVDWELLPADAVATVDGFAGGKDLQNIYNNNVSAFTMEVYSRDSARKTSTGPDFSFNVMIKDFDAKIVKRNIQSPDGKLTDYWDVSLQLEEV
jgi:hypothetical protein